MEKIHAKHDKIGAIPSDFFDSGKNCAPQKDTEQFSRIYEKIRTGESLTYTDALEMLSVEQGSPFYYQLLSFADSYSRIQFGGQGKVFAQIGLDAQPCPVNCRFCSLSADLLSQTGNCSKKTDEEILELVHELVYAGAEDLFLMTTAAYDAEEFLRIGRLVKETIPETMRLVANVADFGEEYAVRLKEAGFTGVYHICRLGEGEDTNASVEQRVQTLESIKKVGLELYYCVEPIGPEHSNEEIATEIFRAMNYPVGVMAVMRRIAIQGSPLYERGEIPAHRLALICAVTVLCCRPKRAMGVHEPDGLPLMAGANQIYAETGANPRDVLMNTEEGRGFSVAKARRLLWEANWK